MEYNVSQIVGKPLYAKKKVGIYRTATDTAKPIYYVAAGQSIGTVYSWLNPNAYRSVLYWVFKDSQGRDYYVRHSSETLSPSKLSKTAEQEQKQQESSTTGVLDKIGDAITKGAETTTEGVAKTANLVVKGGLIFGGVLLGLKLFDSVNNTNYADLSDFKRDFERWKNSRAYNPF